MAHPHGSYNTVSSEPVLRESATQTRVASSNEGPSNSWMPLIIGIVVVIAVIWLWKSVGKLM